MSRAYLQNIQPREGYEHRLSTHDKAAARIREGWRPRASRKSDHTIAFQGRQVIGNKDLVLLERKKPVEEDAKGVPTSTDGKSGETT